MTFVTVCCWLCLFCVLYTYILYPLILAIVARLRPRQVVRREGGQESVSIILSVYNEEASIGNRLTQLRSLLASIPGGGEVIVVSDGSTDRTAEIARQQAGAGVRVLELVDNCGKAAALSAGCAAAQNDILVFADVRQTWDPQALLRLLENFNDPSVGAVSGDLVLCDAAGALQGVALYWRYEKLLRRLESQVWSVVGSTGAISAVRRFLFRPIPSGTLLDDVYWPLQVALQGRRVVHDSRAIAYDRLPARTGDEFRRKVRTLAGNFQLLGRLPAALLPWRNPIWVQLVSHKLLRLLVPWALIGLLVCSALLPGPVYRLALASQLAGYGLALLALYRPVAAHSRIASAAASFLVLNTAAWMAFWVWLAGKAGQSWHKVVYQAPTQQSHSRRPFSCGLPHPVPHLP